MDKSAKIYKRAMEKYQEGYIDEALEYCEKCISLNIKNSAALNLKGLLLYLKGELEGARSIWRLNKDLNKDSVSKRYIESAESDEERKHIYETALGLLKEIRVKEALELLEKCRESDYNAINVGNAISSCLIKQGEYKRAIEFINKVLNLDKKNKTARENKNMLIQYGIIKRSMNYSKITVGVGIIFIVTLSFFIAIKSKNLIDNRSNVAKKLHSKEQIIQKEDIKIVEEKKEERNEVKEEEKPIPTTFPLENIKASIEGKKYEELYKYYLEWRNKAASINEKNMMGNVQEILKNEGAQFFYSLGNQYVKDKDNNNALENYKKAYEVGKSSFIYPHVIFFLGASYERVEDYENALKLYKEYYENYSQGDYCEEVLYRITMIYEKVDINTAKKYASELANKYPKSIYNNSKLKQIINEN